MSSRFTVYYGPVINPKSLTLYETIPSCLLAVSSTGNIEWIAADITASHVHETIIQKGCTDFDVVRLGSGEFIIPGFIDTHTHACQFSAIGTGYDKELLDWLADLTYPGEARFSDPDFARRIYPGVVRRTLNCGTTACCYYGTLHLEATKILANVAHAMGQRAFVGKCNMDQSAPQYYIEPSPSESIQATKALLEHIQTLDHSPAGEPLVHPILTPRFAISCSPELLKELGKLAAANPSLAIQTHVSENKEEVKEVHRLFGCDSYAGVYDTYHLLRENTILAHGIYLTDDEVKLLKERNVGISHCPGSNFHVNSGVARVGEWLDQGIKVGLGTDVSGGYSPSILTAVQHASIASKVIAMEARSGSHRNGHGHDHPHQATVQFSNKQLPIATLFYLATLGGANVCCLQQRVGSFGPGKAFDALVVSVRNDTGNPGVWGVTPSESEDVSEDVMKGWLEQFLFCGDDRNIRRVIVQGKVVGGLDFTE
ncbi:hypothetical protein SERLA73DRAFT_169494 [Serpula lacrymans var. lacrymans S7.3]|uniref:Guanine deaminase n=2 Tax=Serpula lacrymans var. lacrymans TaxID=341189 RepID=F8Q079_SERL3|nr:uncharacterized protein SERLADRAFT_450410 [Serpula lacrymans var. lacrymans S7.9]EGN98551.1 hypothetical protein SERLA73DRAFT_169494 [Serpula lacrymans var. lacrymans S7.3]EGO24119.1 hypothetical protein SERLADRAFT_450410 [Serpula lacrymans var. lacrymans S7.9]